MQCVTMLCILRTLAFRECAQSSSRRLQGELPAGSVVHAVVHKLQQVWRGTHVMLHHTVLHRLGNSVLVACSISSFLYCSLQQYNKLQVNCGVKLECLQCACIRTHSIPCRGQLVVATNGLLHGACNLPMLIVLISASSCSNISPRC